MKPAIALICSIFLALSVGTDSKAKTDQGTKTVFKAALPQLDQAETPKLKPFTLGAQTDVLRGEAQGEDMGLRFRLCQPQQDNLSRPFKLKASEMARLIASYQIHLLVDRSNSMKELDCPGGLSRWQWCGLQASGLAQAIAPYAPQGLTIVPFATEYDVFEHAGAAHINYIFDNMRLQFGTRLYEPIAEQVDTYFADHSLNKKPLLLVIVTDGLPVPQQIEPDLVRRELVAISSRMTAPEQVTVIFCQIGANDRRGAAFLQDLDENLTSYGAKYRFVHTISFDDMQQYGLGPALAAAIEKYSPRSEISNGREPVREEITHISRLSRGPR